MRRPADISKTNNKMLKKYKRKELGTKNAMSILNSFVNAIIESLAAEASRVAIDNEKSTISFAEVQTSLVLLLPAQLSRHAISKGTAAVASYPSWWWWMLPTCANGPASINNTSLIVGKLKGLFQGHQFVHII